MDELIKHLPQLVPQLENALGQNPDALRQVRKARVRRVTFDADSQAGYVYTHPSRDLSAVEQNIVGVKHGRTIEIPGDIWMYIDLDNFDRLTGIEVLDVSHELCTLLTGLSNRFP